MSLQRKHYGPPRRIRSNSYSNVLESIENFKNKIILNEYTDLISNNLKDLELNSTINPSMIDLQPEIKWFMRPFLVNFIIQLHSNLKLKPQTLFLTWNIIDNYCSKRIVFKQHYQLIGCTSLWIASKFEDKKSRVPTIKELISYCSNIYDDSMFKEMEIHILSTLNWSLNFTNFEDILQLSIKSSDPDGKELLNKPLNSYKSNTPIVSAILAVSRYLCELSLYERDFLNYSTSSIGSTCFLMACSILNMDYGLNLILNLLNDSSSSIISPFLQGFNGQQSINEIKNISLLLYKSILSPSDVLIEKYNSLGVITVVNRFLDDNNLLLNQSSNISNLLLRFPNNPPFSFSSSSNSNSISISNDSIFNSNTCDSPSNFSSFSSVSSATSYNSDFADLKETII
ncbi:hypothetical protein CANINC_001472 [Pichia inconspicua]|uniref:Cyclin-like domain-containing protein n=1 Tax=Pichia inconspicua TaxID=52247 RepID=A0A4T0X3K6_9ASCO|nr:hypothetical protein CANINC_001472 [[Candida] inconspicua]